MSAPQLDIGQLSDEEVRARVKAAFQVDPCHWQVQAIRTLSQRADKISEDQCVISATGSGKTIAFLAPLLFVPQGTLVIISPLNLLSEQIATQLQNMRIPAIAVTAENATRNVFQAIRELKYRVVVTNIEIAGRPQGEFEKLWRDRKWSSKLICVVWDEAHCVSKWADFRPEYKDAGRIRRVVPDHIPFFLTSATLPKAVLLDVYRNLGLQASNVNVIHRSNDRPNIHLVVRRMQHALGSFRDLDFIIPTDGRPPPTFVIFFNDIRQSVKAVKYLCSRLPEADKHRIKWFNSHMSPEFRRAEMENLASGETWGLICTDSFGLGVDTVRYIRLIIQYRVKGINMCTLYQRIGRAIRSGEGSATALILVEPEFFDEEREEKHARKRKKEESADSAVKGGDGAERGNKRRKTDDARVPTTVEVVMRGGPDSVVTERDSLLASRRVLYDTLAAPAPKKKGRAKAKSAVAIEPALDDMINAQSRGFNCYRIPGQLYFGNDRIVSNPKECKPQEIGGCSRCTTRASILCCALCSPDHFLHFTSSPASSRSPNVEHPGRAGKKKAYSTTRDDYILREKLHLWRTERTIAEAGHAWMLDFGVSLVLSDEILTSIVDHAHHNRIHSPADLAQHAKWHNSARYGEDIVAIIHQVRPPSLAVAPVAAVAGSVPDTPDGLVSTPSGLPPPEGPPKRIHRCGRCLQTGHNKRSRKCPGLLASSSETPLAPTRTETAPTRPPPWRVPLAPRRVDQAAPLLPYIPPSRFYAN